jgi:hypothetical protein
MTIKHEQALSWEDLYVGQFTPRTSVIMGAIEQVQEVELERLHWIEACS